MVKIPYDATRDSLYHPGKATDFFRRGALTSDAAICAEMSRLAYVKEETHLEIYLERAFFRKDLAHAYSSPGLQAFVATKEADGLTVVAFRGSEPDDPDDIFTDAEFVRSSWADGSGREIGTVHKGFARSLLKDDNLVKLLDAVKLAQPKRLLLTGHSLGAALAVLFATRVDMARSIYTFGSPRVGDAAFAKAVSAGVSGILVHERFVDCCDSVTRTPPSEFGYKHAGLLRYIDRDGHLLTEPSHFQMAADRRIGAAPHVFQHPLLWKTVAARELADHAPINYLSGVLGLR